MKDIPNDPIAMMNGTFDAMSLAHAADPYPDYALRKDRLERLEKATTTFAERLVTAMQQDFSHRSDFEANSLDVTFPIGEIRMNLRHLKKWMRPRRYPMPKHLLPARARVIAQPKGVAGIISPWNLPVYLSIPPMAAALAAGNRVMLKPSELTPHTSDVLQAMFEEFFYPDEAVVITGGVQVAQAFSNLPFGHMLFTGSTEVGRKVAQAAAKNLTPVTLELGGKSPAIVGQGADLDYAARRIAFGKTVNSGQLCVAPDYVLVPREKIDGFVTATKTALQQLYPDGTDTPDYTAIISDSHRARLEALVKDARDAGADVIDLNADIQDTGRKLAPTLIVDPPLSIRAMQEEIFGPVLPIIPYDTAQDALDFVARRASPLALYIFTDDKSERDLWLRKSLSGGMCVNETSLHVLADTLPFGGVGASGMGAYHGRAGFETFSHMKSVFYQPKLNAAFLFNPPITGIKQKIARLLRKFI
jgi:coniferyl-aldehyde dehydrogenase